MRVVIAGGRGMIGAALARSLTAIGHHPLALTRGEPASARDLRWDAAAPDPRVFERADVVVNLAGATLARRWTASVREEIVESRVGLTSRLVAAMARAAHPPRVLVSASAIGWYGDRGDELLDEASERGRGFLAELAQRWEQAAISASASGVRVVRLRIGIVLSARGGVLARLAPLYRAGLGGPIGDGRMWWSWIALDDLVAMLTRSVVDDTIEGVMNSVSPAPVRQADFARALGRALGRPARFPTPAVALRLAFGRMADEVLLAGQRVRPRRWIEAGGGFRHSDLDGALRDALEGRGDLDEA
ncbi:MAG: TIGR01777 family protein [Candidatus Eisenbacteria bacterium]|nr:TIGR01777 family protein [Candidatus Eisenbacteria bacterium]